jgi:hypothetical protein
LQPAYGGGSGDAFVSKINTSGSALVYSTYLGGSSNDYGEGIALDSAGNAYVTGYTVSTDFPTMNPLQPANGGNDDAFVAKLNPSGSALVYSTYLGGNSIDQGHGIAVDSAGSAYVTGFTASKNFPTINPLQRTFGGGYDAFVGRVNSSGSALVYSTYLGGSVEDDGYGIALDSAGNTYITGYTNSTNFPAAPGSFQTVCNGGKNCENSGDAFLAKIYPQAETTTMISSSLNPSTYGQTVTFTAVVTSGVGAPPDGETVTFEQGSTVLGAGALGGGRTTFSTSTLGVGTKGVRAVYGGDSSFAASTSNAVSQVVSKASTTPILVSSLNPSKFGQSVTFTAMVKPQFSGTPTGTVTFKNGTATLATVALSGGIAKFTTSTLTAGTHSITAVYGGDVTFLGSTSPVLSQVVNGPVVTLSSTRLTFSTRAIGTTSPATTVTLRNTDTASLTITGIAITGTNAGDFAQTHTCGSSLAAGASCGISVTFKPTASGTRTAALSITDNAAGSPQRVTLSGVGTTAKLPATSLSFGSVAVGTTSVAKTVTLTNVGTTTLTITGMAITGTNAGDFAQTNTCGTSVAAGASCFVTVTFTPSATGKRTAAISVSDNGGGSPQKVSLTGTGT